MAFLFFLVHIFTLKKRRRKIQSVILGSLPTIGGGFSQFLIVLLQYFLFARIKKLRCTKKSSKKNLVCSKLCDKGNMSVQ